MMHQKLKYLFCMVAFWASMQAHAQLEFNFSDTVVTECKGILYDNGGDGVNYLHNTNQTFTICLDAPGTTTLTFESFCVEVGFDSLTFHWGPNETYPQIGPAYSGTTVPPPISFTQAVGCISLHFVTDANVSCTGWEASWTTEVIPPVPPQIDAVLPAPACSSTTATINLSKKLHCDSVYAGAFEFLGPEILEGLMDQTITSVQPVNCVGDSTQQVAMVFSPGLNQGGTYQIELTTNYYDACDSLWTFTTVDSFRVDDCPIVVTLIPERDSICVGECTPVEAIVTGGNGVYSYTWTNGLPPTAGPQTVCPVTTTTYSLTVDDTSPALPASGSALITVFTPPTVPPASNQCQSDPPVDLVASPAGGWWIGPGITDSLAGTFVGDSANAGPNTVGYYLPITPSFGCTSLVTISILPIDAGLPNAACPGSPPFQLTGFIPVGGTWSGPNVTPTGVFSPDVAGVYSVTYTVNGCTEDRLIYVDQISNAPVAIDSLCQSDSSIQYVLSPPGGRWSGPGIVDSLTGLFDPGEAEGGLHTITYSLFGCEQEIQVFVKEIFAGWNSNACPSESLVQLEEFYPPGGIWSGDGIIDPNLGTVNPNFNNGENFETELIYTLPNGCTDTTKLYVQYTRIDEDTIVFCKGDRELQIFDENLDFGPWGGEWSGPGIVPGEDEDSTFFLTDLSGNGIHPIVYSNNTCTDTVWFVVQHQILSPLGDVCESSPDFEIPLPAYVSAGSFLGEGIQDTLTGMFSPSAAEEGEHEITFTSSLGCSDTLTVGVLPFLEAEIDAPGGLLCYVDTLIEIEVSPAGGELQGPGIVDSLYFNPYLSDEGEHQLIYSIGEGYCRSTDTALVTVAPRVGYEISVSDDSLCVGDYTSIAVSAWGGNGGLISYTWNEGLSPLQQHVVSPMQTTSYTLLLTDGCTVIRDTIPVVVAAPVTYSVITSDVQCYGLAGFAMVESTNSVPYEIAWRGDIYQPGDSLPGQASNTYALSVVDPNSGCKSDTSITLPGFPLVKAQFSVNPSLECIPEDIRDINFIDLSTGATQGTWNFGDGTVIPYVAGENPTHEYILHGGYSILLEVADSNGCNDKTTREICLEEPYKVYVPTAFTLNDDNLNEVFLARGTGILDFNMWVYDRRGVVIFSSDSIDRGWDGTYMGSRVQSGVYTWLIEVQWTNKQWFNSAGTVTLIR